MSGSAQHTRAQRGAGGARKVLVAGGGVAALEAILALRALVPDVGIELIAPGTAFEYKPISVLQPFALADAPEIELGRIAEEQRVTLVRDTLTGVDTGAQAILTGRGDRRDYDFLLIVTGASALPGVPGTRTFRGRVDYEQLAILFEEYVRGQLRRLAFTVPSGTAWTLPIYELALLASSELRTRGTSSAELAIVTPEPAPLQLFGPRASEDVAELLHTAHIEVLTSTHPRNFAAGVLHAAPATELQTDRVISLPRLVGHRFDGLPSDRDGFVPTDAHGRVDGLADVYAAGDITTFPVKQGGIACQQADAAAESIAAQLGASVEPRPFKPVMRGMLLSGAGARYLESDPSGGQGDALGGRFTLWEPTAKVFGRHLLPYLRKKLGDERPNVADRGDGVPVEVDLEAVHTAG